MTSHVLLVPAFEPSQAFPQLLRDLRQRCSYPFVVVDDGSGPDYAGRFEEARAVDGTCLIQNAVNLGKGAALKHGLNHSLLNFPEAQWIVTADADGQHLPDDILAVAEASAPNTLVLGARQFERDVPLRSRIGNILSKYVYRLLVRIRLRDTQTGLRSIPRRLAERCLSIRSNRYEFETEQLVTARQAGFAFKEVGIRTVYLDDNAGSHFDPILDSFRIYFALLRYGVSSLVTLAADLAVFSVLLVAGVSVVAANLVSFAAAASVQFLLLRQYVFKTPAGLVTFIAFVGYALVSRYVSAVLQVELTSELLVPPLVAKIVVDSCVFLINFLLLRDVIFRRWSLE